MVDIGRIQCFEIKQSKQFHILRNYKTMQKYSQYVVLDMGGTLNKLCFLSSTTQTNIPHNPQLNIKLPDCSLYFKHFSQVEECFTFIDTYFKENEDYTTIAVTGGGSFKYEEELNKFGKKIVKVKQFESLLEGLNFFKAFPIQEFSLSTFKKGIHQKATQQVFFQRIKVPFLVVNIGSGVSVLKIQPKDQKFEFQRVGGTSLGGGFFMGLARLLLNQTNFQKLIQLAGKGVNQKIDYVFQDFPSAAGYLSEASVLVSLAKLDKNSKRQDIAKSLFKMVSFNIAQLGLMYSDLYGIEDIIFTGHFCRNNNFVLDCFAQAFHFFQNSRITMTTKRAYSLKHDGYLGTIGALNILLKQQKLGVLQQKLIQ